MKKHEFGETAMRVSKFDAWGNDFLVLDVADVPANSIAVTAGSAAAPHVGAPDWPAAARSWCHILFSFS